MTNKNPAPKTTEMESLLHESELRIKQLELDLQFKKNLAYFKEKIPTIYEQHVNHTPTELRLEYDQRGFVNLVNFGKNTHPVYEDDPEAFSCQQVKNFIAKPQVSTCGYSKAITPSKTHKHIPIQNALIDELDINNLNVTPRTDVPIGCMIITGCGLGYHIPELLDNLEINNIIIFDSHKDSFYASLHTIDWEPLLKRFTTAGRSIYFLLDQTPEVAMTHIGVILQSIGLHNMAYYYNYYHFYSKVEKDFSDLFAKQFHIMASSTGYFDDEQVGLSHTIHNLKNGIKIFNEKPYPKSLPHALVVGNGPSLDLHIDFIKKHRDDTILFSCGTALGSLAKLGIKPDFHVEVERNINITEWITKGTTSAYRDGIALLCLNTISPAAADLFNEAYMAKKPYDIGESYIDKSAASQQATLLEQCNPTVSNAGLSYAVAMGFNNIHLVGMDLGFPERGKHHSEHSLYRDIEKISNADSEVFNYTQGQYAIPGNFGGETSTNIYLDATRVSIENLLRSYRNKREGIHCYNSNNGAFIANTIPTKIEDLRIEKPDRLTSDTVRDIKNYFFFTPLSPDIDIDNFAHNELKAFYALRNEFKINKNVRNPSALLDEFNRIIGLVNSLAQMDHPGSMLVRGSIQSILTIITKACLFQKDEETFVEKYHIGQKRYSELMDYIYDFMINDPLKLDDTWDDVIKTLKKQKNQEL